MVFQKIRFRFRITYNNLFNNCKNHEEVIKAYKVWGKKNFGNTMIEFTIQKNMLLFLLKTWIFDDLDAGILEVEIS